MLDYLELLDEQLGRRYRTLENNLRSASNSFYDSYREVVLEFVRLVYRREGLRILRSDGSEVDYSDRIELNRLMTSPSLCERLVESGVDEGSQAKLRDYIAKVNGHVHRREKEISFEGVVDYLLALYNYSAPYVSSLGIKCVPPSLNEINSLYAEYEKSIAAFSLFEGEFVTRVQGIIDEHIPKEASSPANFEYIKPRDVGLDERTLNEAFASCARRGLAFLGGERSLKNRKTVFLLLICGMLLFALLYLFLSGVHALLLLGSLFSLTLYVITLIKTIPMGVEQKNVDGLVMLECAYCNKKLVGAGQFKSIYFWGFVSSLIGFAFELTISYLSTGSNGLLGFSYLHIIYMICELFTLIYGYFFLFNRYNVIILYGNDPITGESKSLYSYKGAYYNDLDKILLT